LSAPTHHPADQKKPRPRPPLSSSALYWPSRLTQLWLPPPQHPPVSRRAPPNTCPFPRFRSLEVFRRRPLSVWDVCDGRRLKTFTLSGHRATAQARLTLTHAPRLCG